MMLDATQKYEEALTEERLFGWHAALFPTGRSSGLRKINVGAWRDDKLRPNAGRLGKPIGKELCPLPGTRPLAAFLRKCRDFWIGSTARLRSIPY